MKKYSSLFVLALFVLITSLPAQGQKSKDPVTQTVQSFPYQHRADAEASLKTMSVWTKSDWKKFMKMLDDDSAKVRATYALNAYVHHVSSDAAKKPELVALLNKQLTTAKTEYSKIFLKTQLDILSDQALVDQANSSLPKLPAYPVAKQSTGNDTQQLLVLEDKMETAKNPLEKKNILAQAARLSGFNTFVFVTHSLQDAEVDRQAALIVSRLAIADESIQGPVVREALEKALPLIKGEDSTFLASKVTARLRKMPYDYGFVSLFNGKDITGWKGLVGNPITRAKMTPVILEKEQLAADAKAKNDWVVKDGLLVFTGHGENLATTKKYGDFEMWVDWKITDKGDAGIYLRGTPQVQIWDISRTDVGAQVGSGGLYNNQKNQSKPLTVADNRVGDWNTFRIVMKGDKVTVYLNGILVTDNVTLENYWDHNLPIFKEEQIELQAHGTYVAYRNLYLREIPSGEPFTLSDAEKKLGFVSLFDGTHLDQWTGNKDGYLVKDGVLEVNPEAHGGGNLYTTEEFANFEYRFEFQLTPGANNGIGIRAPLEGDAAYVGMEIQVLDSENPKWSTLQPYQYHGSVYGVIPAKRGFLLPPGEWNKEEIIMKGTKIKVVLNGTVILDSDIKEASKNGTIDHNQHPGLSRTTGHIGFLGHGDVVRFRKMRVKKI